MPRYSSFTTIARLMAALLVAVAIFAPTALEARDDIEYGRYLGVRLRMYDESREVLTRTIEDGTADEVTRAKQTLAEVIKDQADYQYPDDESARMKLYREAVDVFGETETPKATLAKSVMQLDLADSLRRSDPESARDYCDDANEALRAHRDELDTMRDNDQDAFAPYAETFNAIWYHLARSYHVKARTYDMESEQRESLLRLAVRELDELDMLSEGVTREVVFAFELRGEIELARGNPAGAVGQFIGLVGFVSAFDANATVGRLALENGYIRAAELLTGELDYEPENLERVISLYAEAYERYGGIDGLDSLFKRFQLYRISALIKLGDPELIEGAVDLLFRLAADNDRTFRQRALTVLADIATRDGLDDELRWRCANTVYGDLDTNPFSVILKNIYAFQTLLESCNDPRTFETYAPAAYHRIGEMYYRMWRFLDAALTYREACYRTLYFREKFDEDAEVAPHMRDRTSLISDPGDAYKFPGEMASLFARNAGFLISPTIGEPENTYFRQLSERADKLKAALAGLEAQLELRYKTALSLYNEGDFHRAAVKYANLPAGYRSYHMALYIAAKAYYNVHNDRRARRINTDGESDEVESQEWFARQAERHAEDLSELPESMWQGVGEAHWQAIMDPDTDPRLANWHKSVYYYKKYFLIEALRRWDDIDEIVLESENPTLTDGISAVAQVINNKWLRDNPTGEGEPDREMRRMGMAAYDLAYMLRTPPRNLPESQRESLRATGNELALRILRPYSNWFGNHLMDSPSYRSEALRLAFGAMEEAGDLEGAEAAYRDFVEGRESQGDLTQAQKDQIRRMAGRLYWLAYEVIRPRLDVLLLLRSRFVSQANLFRRNAYEHINAEQFPEDAEKLAEAEGRLAGQRVLANHYWDVWVLRELFHSDRREEIESYAPEVLPELKRRWDELAEEYPARWGRAVRAEFDRRMETDTYADIRDEVAEALEGRPDTEILDVLNTLRREAADPETGDDASVQLYVDLIAWITNRTDALQYFTGTLFIYEWSSFLQDWAEDLNGRAKPLVTRMLRHLEESRNRRDESGAEGLSAVQLLTMGNQYFRINDWRRTVRYLEAFVEERLSGQVNPWGSVESIVVNERSRSVGRTDSGEELQVRFQLGKAHLELYKENGDVEHLKQAALHMRRCWCFNLVRDAKEVGGSGFKLLFQRQIEEYYLRIGRSMAEIFMLLHDAPEEVEIDWPEYQNQYTEDLTQHEDKPLQSVPENRPAMLWEAMQIHLRVWTSYALKNAYPYRDEFQYHFEHWLIHAIDWIETYGTETHGIVELAGDRRQEYFNRAVNRANRESELEATHLPESMQQYLVRLGEHADRIAELID